MSAPSRILASAVVVRLLDGFSLSQSDATVGIPPSGQRLVAFLALRTTVSRAVVADALWPEAAERKTQANLRTAVWRVNRAVPGLVVTCGTHLALAPCAVVDSREFAARVARVGRSPEQSAPPSFEEGGYAWLFAGELLPGWYDDWVLLEQERMRQLRLHALEAVARRLTARGQYLAALELAFEAVRLEPLRESASRAVIAVHRAEGNAVDAVRHYRWFCALLEAELGMRPSSGLTTLAHGCG